TKPLENRVSQEAPRVPGKEQVKLVPLPAPSADLPVRRSVPVSEETTNVQQQVSVSVPSKEMETVPEIRETPLPEKQHVGEESAVKSANVPEQEPSLITVASGLPKEKGPLKRIVIKGDSVSRVLVDTYGYCDPVLMQLFKMPILRSKT